MWLTLSALHRQEKLTRHDLGREKVLERVLLPTCPWTAGCKTFRKHDTTAGCKTFRKHDTQPLPRVHPGCVELLQHRCGSGRRRTATAFAWDCSSLCSVSSFQSRVRHLWLVCEHVHSFACTLGANHGSSRARTEACSCAALQPVWTGPERCRTEDHTVWR